MAYISNTTCNPGLGCACGGTCGGCPTGLGLFDSGLNFDQWGFAEWAAVAVGAYLVISLFGDTKRGTQRVSRAVRSRSSRAKKRERLKKELAEVS